MRYLILIYEPTDSTPEDMQADLAKYAAFTSETMRRGAFKAGEALQPITAATTVRVRGGRTLATDGPFAETKEALGGFYLLDCPNLDEAIELAAMIPAAGRGSVEIRPIWELPMEYLSAVAGPGAGAG